MYLFFSRSTPLSGGRHRYGCRNGLIFIADMLTVLTAFSEVFLVRFDPAVLPVLVPYPINGYGTKEAGGGLAAGWDCFIVFCRFWYCHSKMCPRCVQDMSMNELGLLAICLLRAQEEISAQDMLNGIDRVSFKQKRRKYLDKLLEMGAISMTIPDKPTSKKQRYILSEIGYDIIHML